MNIGKEGGEVVGEEEVEEVAVVIEVVEEGGNQVAAVGLLVLGACLGQGSVDSSGLFVHTIRFNILSMSPLYRLLLILFCFSYGLSFKL